MSPIFSALAKLIQRSRQAEPVLINRPGQVAGNDIDEDYTSDIKEA